MKSIEIPNQDEQLAFIKQGLAHGWPDNYVPTSKSELHGFYETHLTKGVWEYVDLWGGAMTDIGFVTVFYKQNLIWGMCYRGGVISKSLGDNVISSDLDDNEIFVFLGESLKSPNDGELPLRGPAEYRSNDSKWLYRYRVHGDFSSFVANEQILFDNNICYERVLTGGSVGDEQLYGSANPIFRHSAPSGNSLE